MTASAVLRPCPGGGALPAPLERIVGRVATIRHIGDELRGRRLVTVVGEGGLGKTTVAVAVAHAAAADFGSDVWFVDLGTIANAEQVGAGIALALGLVGADDVAERIVAFAGHHRGLLVLDNCEHVTEAVASLVERIVSAAAGLHVLATSREPLRVRAEHVYRLAPLEVPPEGRAITATEALRFAAVELFVERAATAGSRLSLTDDDAVVVADICRRLDGSALAIEFAAARVDAYGIRGTATLLENRFRLLGNGRTVVPRHQTLGALLDWSYDLLDEAERTTLRRLSILIGPFSLDAVATIGAVDGDEERAVELLGSLVDKSLVAFDARALDGAHYRLLETTRAYARAKLDKARERDAVALVHARWQCGVLDRMRRGEDPVRTPALQLGNIRSALEWCFSDSGDSALGAQLAAAAVPLFMALSLLRECHEWVEKALSHLPEKERGTRRELELQAALGVAMMFTRGNGTEVRTALSRALALAEELDDAREQLRLLGALHILLTRTTELRDALAVAECSEQVAARLPDDPAAPLLASWMVGTSLHLLGDPVAAEARCREATHPMPISRSTATLYFGFDHRVRALIVLARSLWLLGRADDGLAVAAQAVREAFAIGQPTTLAIALVYASSVRQWSGDFEGARGLVESLIEHARRHSLGPYHMVGIGLRGELAIKRGDLSGVEALRRAIEFLRAGHHDLLQTVFATALAEGLAGSGQFATALATIDDAIASTERNGGACDLPEMLRVKGQLLVTMPAPDEAEGERCLLRALELARNQGAVAWQLRAATALAEVWSRQGRTEEARALLQSALASFEQGLRTADLLAARELLSRL